MAEQQNDQAERRIDGAERTENRLLTEWDTPVGYSPAMEPGAPGGVVQDDPQTQGAMLYPDTGDDGALTIVAVFTNMTGAQACAEDLERHDLTSEIGLLPRRGDGPEQGLRPGNVITGPGYGLSAGDGGPPRDPGMGAGVAVGATVGATLGLLAATYIIPAFGTPLVGTGTLVSTLAGAAVGSFIGGLFQFGVREKGDDASLYAGQVRHGGVILTARVNAEHADEARHMIGQWDPLEIRVQ